jgi:hypothetical protein
MMLLYPPPYLHKNKCDIEFKINLPIDSDEEPYSYIDRAPGIPILADLFLTFLLVFILRF